MRSIPKEIAVAVVCGAKFGRYITEVMAQFARVLAIHCVIVETGFKKMLRGSSASQVPLLPSSVLYIRLAVPRRSILSLIILAGAYAVFIYEAAGRETQTLARYWPPENKISVAGGCHFLLLYGLAESDIPSFRSGKKMLTALTHEETAIAAFGVNPLVITRNGIRYALANEQDPRGTEAHRDQCLATFAAINLPLSSPIQAGGKRFAISDLLRDSIANFNLEQKEITWTALSYATYIAPRKSWTNRFSESTSFSQLAVRLLETDLNTQSCGGTHILQALIAIENADRKHTVLNSRARTRAMSYIKRTISELVQRQDAGGAWGKTWNSSMTSQATSYEQTTIYKLLISGHILECLIVLDDSYSNKYGAIAKGREWLLDTLNELRVDSSSGIICPATHAIRAARGIK